MKKPIPDYAGEIKTIFLPKQARNFKIFSDISSIVSEVSNKPVETIEVHKYNTTKSLWLRDIGLCLNYKGSKPKLLIPDESVKNWFFNKNDIKYLNFIWSYFKKRGFDLVELPVLIEGGDCIITKDYAIFGFSTLKLNQKNKNSKEKVTDTISRFFNKENLDCIFLDDYEDEYYSSSLISKSINESIALRLDSGFYHLDTISSVVQNLLGEEVAIVAETDSDMIDSFGADKELYNDCVKYSNFVKTSLSRKGFEINRQPAICSENFFWSSTCSTIIPSERKILLADPQILEYSQKVQLFNEELGYKTEFFDLPNDFFYTDAGFRCLTLIEKR